MTRTKKNYQKAYLRNCRYFRQYVLYHGFKNKLFLVIYNVANNTTVQVIYKH